ncbi:hypothetical protein L1887_48960 [Cichorium endivia]|nr:hypothetical protein L1887_48960 [Cichorium endivia]
MRAAARHGLKQPEMRPIWGNFACRERGELPFTFGSAVLAALHCTALHCTAQRTASAAPRAQSRSPRPHSLTPHTHTAPTSLIHLSILRHYYLFLFAAPQPSQLRTGPHRTCTKSPRPTPPSLSRFGRTWCCWHLAFDHHGQRTSTSHAGEQARPWLQLGALVVFIQFNTFSRLASVVL